MSQIILYQCKNGIILGTDSRAVAFSDAGNPEYFMVKKVFQLTPKVLCATAGMGYGVLLCQAFRDWVRRMRVFDVEDIMELAPQFFQQGLQEWWTEHGPAAVSPELAKLYIIIAGHSESPRDAPFPFLVLVSEQASEPLRILKTAHVVAIPRQMRIEYRLSQLQAEQISLAEVEGIIEKYLIQMMENSDDIGAPLYFARITEKGTEIRTGLHHDGEP